MSKSYSHTFQISEYLPDEEAVGETKTKVSIDSFMLLKKVLTPDICDAIQEIGTMPERYQFEGATARPRVLVEFTITFELTVEERKENEQC